MAAVRRLKRVRTRTGITMAVILLAIAPLLILAAISLSQQRSAALADTYVELDGLADTQVAHLESIVETDTELAEIVATNSNLKLGINAIIDGDPTAVPQVRQGLSNAVLSSDRLINIALYDAAGTPLASFDEASPVRYAALEDSVGTDPVLAKVVPGRTGAPTMLTSTIAYDGTTPIGVVVIETDGVAISELAATYTSLSQTSETSVAQPTAEGAQFIAPLRFKEDAVLNITVPSANVNAPISLAMAGFEGRFGETTDYRAEEVLVVTRHMEDTGWGVVVKIDKSEALAGVDDFRNTVLAALAVVAVLVLGLWLAIGRAIWRPVHELTATAAAVADGDLTRRADVDGDGEIGELARAVNSMTDDLVNAAETSKARRVELEDVNVKLAASEEELSSFFEKAVDGLVVVDSEGFIHRMNRAGQVLFDLDADAAKGMPIAALLTVDGVGPDRLFEVASRHHDGIEMSAKNFRGEVMPLHVAVSRIELNGEFWYTGAIRDMSERQALQERLRYLAHHDDVTGLPNRACLREVLEDSMRAVEDSNERVGLLFLDLDQFKLVNDSRGHAAGDQLLRVVGRRLERALRNEEKVARFGGDEFVVLSPRINEAVELEILAQRVHTAFEKPVEIDGESEHVSFSIGAALSLGGSDADSLISNADVAMYRAKAAGRSRTVLFDAEMRGQVEARHQLQTALRQAVENDEITVHYQPIVELDSGEICGVETLARWHRVGYGPVSPAEFIPIAEESGLIVPLGRSIFRQACEQQVAWSEERPDANIRITVNMSARQLMQPDCVDTVRRILRDTGAEPTALLIEVTESVLSADIDMAARRLNEMRDLGLAIAVDDFGTGYSSLTYLREFPLDVVKIDRSFMSELEDRAVESSIVALVVGLGRSLDIRVVAEGVETEGQLRALRELGCELGQGYLFAKPQSAEDVARLLWPDFDSAADITLNAA